MVDPNRGFDCGDGLPAMARVFVIVSSVVVARDGVVFKEERREEGRKWFGLKVCPNGGLKNI